MSGQTPGPVDPWQVITDLAHALLDGDGAGARLRAIDVLSRNGISLGTLDSGLKSWRGTAREPQPASASQVRRHAEQARAADDAVGTAPGSPVCHRDHWQWGRDMPMDRILTAEGGWECPGIRPDRSGDCGFRIGVAIAPELAAARDASDLEVAAVMAERNQLRAALQRLASEDWLGTQGYDGDELQRRMEFARDKLAAIRPELTESAEP